MISKKRELCPACVVRLLWRPRGLCIPCYRSGVRLPPRDEDANLWEAESDPPMPETPTRAAPGSEAKIEVMAQRLELGQAIFHPDDAWR